jgi:type I restriction enzyme R subunit
MDAEKLKAFNKFVADEKLNGDKLKKLTEDYIFTQRTPTKQEVVDLLEHQPSIMQRASVGDLILSKFMNFINTFFND